MKRIWGLAALILVPLALLVPLRRARDKYPRSLGELPGMRATPDEIKDGVWDNPSFEFSPDSAKFVTTRGGKIQIFGAYNGALLHQQNVSVGAKAVSCWNKTSQNLTTVFVPFAASGQRLQPQTVWGTKVNFESAKGPNGGEINDYQWQLKATNDGLLVLTLNRDLYIWEAKSGRFRAHWSNPKLGFAQFTVSPRGNFAAFGQDNRILILDLTKGKTQRQFLLPRGDLLVKFSDDADYFLAETTESGLMWVKKTTTGETIFQDQIDGEPEFDAKFFIASTDTVRVRSTQTGRVLWQKSGLASGGNNSRILLDTTLGSAKWQTSVCELANGNCAPVRLWKAPQRAFDPEITMAPNGKFAISLADTGEAAWIPLPE